MSERHLIRGRVLGITFGLIIGWSVAVSLSISQAVSGQDPDGGSQQPSATGPTGDEAPEIVVIKADDVEADAKEVQERDQELKVLREQVQRLQAQVKALELEMTRLRRLRQNRHVEVIQFERPSDVLTPIPSRVGPSAEVEKVFRWQFESPEMLFDGLHDRERRLRERLFVPELGGGMPRR